MGALLARSDPGWLRSGATTQGHVLDIITSRDTNILNYPYSACVKARASC